MLAGLFYALRRLEVWLHQHIFKVGWLVTKQYQTTTILYYAFFLPGILLNQIVYWATAGFLNVRAERSIVWPEKQEIGELKLSFVRIAKDVDSFRLAIIASTPLIVGMLAVWHIAVNVLAIPANLVNLQSGVYGDLTNGISHLTSAPDFWLWLYLAFTISNTMMPNFALLRGWRVVIIAIGAIIVALFLVGVGNQVVLNNLQTPVTNALGGLSTLFAIIIGIDFCFLAILGTLEAVIERLTGDSATFENGKMITMRYAELQERRREQAKAAAKRTAIAEKKPQTSGVPTVYSLPFPIPEPPGREAVTRSPSTITVSKEDDDVPPAPALGAPRQTPAIVSGRVTDKPPQLGASNPSEESKPPIPPLSSGVRPSLQSSSPPPASGIGGNRPALPASSPPPAAGIGGNRPALPAAGAAPRPASPFAAAPKPPGLGAPATPKPAFSMPKDEELSDDDEIEEEDIESGDDDQDDGAVTYEDFEDPA